MLPIFQADQIRLTFLTDEHIWEVIKTLKNEGYGVTSWREYQTGEYIVWGRK